MKSSKGLQRICAALIGIVFLLSSLLKLQDPVGTGLIMEEYFKFLHIEALRPAARLLGILISLGEGILGVGLLAGIWRGLVLLASGVVLLFFTTLTLILLIANPHMDCGCFGQMIHLTHAQSFIKNVVLLALWALAYVPSAFLGFGKEHWKKYISFGASVCALLVFAVWSNNHLPLLDKTSLALGTELEDMETVMSVRSFDGEYCEDMLLDGPVMIVSAYDVEKLSEEELSGARSLLRQADGYGYRTLFVATSTEPDFYFADRRDLLSLNRSNGGATFVCDGQIVRKWHANNYPDQDELAELQDMDPTEIIAGDLQKGAFVIQGTTLAILLLFLLI